MVLAFRIKKEGAHYQKVDIQALPPGTVHVDSL
jgi:hypothetical protein